MRQNLDALIELQDIDWQLKKLADSKGDLPQIVESLSTKVQNAKKKLQQYQDDKKEKSSKRASLDSDVALFRENLKKYQNQLYHVKNNKEYDAITSEIDNTQETIDQNEYESLELEEAVNEIDGKIKEMEEEIQKLQAELDKSNQYLKEMLAKTDDEERVLNEKRAPLLEALPKPILNHYERIRAGRGGMALSLLKNGACSECSAYIPPQRAMEVRMMNDFYLCEVCGRILVYRPDLDQEAANKENEE